MSPRPVIPQIGSLFFRIPKQYYTNPPGAFKLDMQTGEQRQVGNLPPPVATSLAGREEHRLNPHEADLFSLLLGTRREGVRNGPRPEV